MQFLELVWETIHLYKKVNAGYGGWGGILIRC